MPTLPELYSGVTLDQSQKPATTSDKISVIDGAWRYQEFFLPTDYKRGDIIPPLTGWQIMAEVTNDAAVVINWTVESKIIGAAWAVVASGTTLGAHATGSKVWVDSYCQDPVDLSQQIIDNRLRIGFQITGGITNVWYSIPNPFALSFARAVQADGITPIQVGGKDLSICFRTLGLVADEGVDFLGNNYRSAVVPSSAARVNPLSGVDDAAWMSDPSPSRFAVKNLFFDVRASEPTQYILNPTYIASDINQSTNPNFEISTVNWVTTNTAYISAGATITRITTDFQFGSACAQVVGGASDWGASNILSGTFTAGQPYTFSLYAKSVSGATALRLAIGNGAGTDFTNANITITGSWARYSITWTPTTTQTSCQLAFLCPTGSAYTAKIDGVMLTADSSAITYFDGDSGTGYSWNGTTGLSASTRASSGIKYIAGPARVEDEARVVDKVLIDPLTPGVYLNIYYSDDGTADANTTEDEWNNKLWTHVPRTYKMLKRESHVLPEPIVTKFIKLEFSHLQAQSYNPGDLARPITYSKHPKWVLDYFLARTTAQKDANRLLSGTVGVIYDALDLAFNYYLDDLRQEPDKPIEIDPQFTTTVTQFLQDRGDQSDLVDAGTLSKINTVLAPYQQHPSVFSKDDYLLGYYSKQTAILIPDYPSEIDPATIDSPDVRELRNEAVVFESDFPVMFFYLTCRHKYREVTAEFSHNRAYFVGVREVAFTRENFTIANDTSSYQEPAGDLTNVARSDFDLVDGTMIV